MLIYSSIVASGGNDGAVKLWHIRPASAREDRVVSHLLEVRFRKISGITVENAVKIILFYQMPVIGRERPRDIVKHLVVGAGKAIYTATVQGAVYRITVDSNEWRLIYTLPGVSFQALSTIHSPLLGTMVVLGDGHGVVHVVSAEKEPRFAVCAF